jgi:hypothetical protein
MQTQEKRKRGRPLNSTTLTTIALSELIAKFGPDTQIPVGRLWLNGGSSTIKETSVTIPVVPSVETPTPENRVEMTLTVD